MRFSGHRGTDTLVSLSGGFSGETVGHRNALWIAGGWDRSLLWVFTFAGSRHLRDGKFEPGRNDLRSKANQSPQKLKSKDSAKVWVLKTKGGNGQLVMVLPFGYYMRT